MAKIKGAPLAPDALPRFRGNIIAYNNQYGTIVAKWPRKRGPPKDWKTYFLSKQFGIAGRYAANSDPLQWETAVFMSTGTVWLPRDILVMAAYGKLYELTGPDGEIYRQADHSAPALEPTPRPPVLQWQPNFVQGALSSANSTSAFASKGVYFAPDVIMELFAVSMVLTPVNGATYKVNVCEVSTGNVILSIQAGTPRTLTGVVKKVYEFQCHATLQPATRYAIMLSRTDSTDTYALAVPQTAATGNYLIPCVDLGACALAKANPAIGQTITPATAVIAANLLLNF